MRTLLLMTAGFVNFLEADGAYRHMHDAGEQDVPSGGAVSADNAQALGSRATLRFNEPVGTVRQQQ